MHVTSHKQSNSALHLIDAIEANIKAISYLVSPTTLEELKTLSPNIARIATLIEKDAKCLEN